MYHCKFLHILVRKWKRWGLKFEIKFCWFNYIRIKVQQMWHKWDKNLCSVSQLWLDVKKKKKKKDVCY